MDKMKLFQNLPIELENIIWIYTGLFKLRNGILVRQTKHLPIIENLFPNSNKNHYIDIITQYGAEVDNPQDPLLQFKMCKSKMNNDICLYIVKKIYPDKIIYSVRISKKNEMYTKKYYSERYEYIILT